MSHFKFPRELMNRCSAITRRFLRQNDNYRNDKFANVKEALDK